MPKGASYMRKSKLHFYCPACGEYSNLVLDNKFLLAPGSNKHICPKCQTEFAVSIEFEEINSI